MPRCSHIEPLIQLLETGGQDCIIVSSDSGRIVVLEYDPIQNSFVKLQQETYGRSGSRRIVPGQYLAVDPKGRAVMIGAVEKSKLVYILNRDAAANLTISSPLEAHKARSVIHSIIGMDVGFENPCFAVLEIDYTESDQDWEGEAFENAEKLLVYYELDLGLNHVVRKWSDPVDPRANMLVQVPGGQSSATNAFDGPSGVLVCCEDFIVYKHVGVPEHKIPIPKRNDGINDGKSVIIVCGVMHKMRTEEGDLFKVTIDHQDEEVQAVKIKYFDTIPVASSMCILKSGFLFAAAETGNHYLYQFEKLGDDPTEPEWSSLEYDSTASFTPRPLTNLLLTDEIVSLSPLTDAKILNLMGTDTPQVITASGGGRSGRSKLGILRQGMETEEVVEKQTLRLEPEKVWTTRFNADALILNKVLDPYDNFVFFSSLTDTLLLSISDSIEEVSESETPFLLRSRTIHVQQIGTSSILQVLPSGLRHVFSDENVVEWNCPSHQSIVCAASNNKQVVLALTGGELVYFEVQDGTLFEFEKRKILEAGIVDMSLPDVPEGRLRVEYLAVGCEDQTIRLLSLDLDPDKALETVSLQALTAMPSSICMAELFDPSIDKNHPSLFVNIGLTNGVFLRTVLDTITGQLTDTRTRFLGSKAVKLIRVKVGGENAVLALSTRSWLLYPYSGKLNLTPLIYDVLDHAAGFTAEVCPEGFIAVAGNSLRMFTLPKLGTTVQQSFHPLTYTPRQLLPDTSKNLLYIAESDHRCVSEELAKKKGIDNLEAHLASIGLDAYGPLRADEGEWASCIRILDPLKEPGESTLEKIILDNNEAAFSLALVDFANRPGEHFLVVGTGSDAHLAPRACRSGYLRTYKVLEDGRKLELLHSTETDDIPTAIIPLEGRLLAGVGKALRIYDMGKKKLLRKAENKSFATNIKTLESIGNRIIIGDMQESILYGAYKAPENRLIVFADDTSPRWITASTLVDYDTVAGGDKFGNIFISRISRQTSNQVDEDPTGAGILHEKSLFMGAPHKSQLLAHFHIGDIVTSLQKTSLVAGGREVIVYTGLMGSVGMLVPFATKTDIDFFSTLEMHLRTETPSLVGRDHLAYRGSYVPVKGVVDGDLCDEFALLPMNKQAQIAGELDRTVSEVLKKLELIKSASGWS
ncbi:hypothetical protein BT69DRAFT_1294288 [Atractiella rhizophila]|nr:hypothetical protein BT69DRAFT_1294288 [Atractiella rhizophila]